MKSNLFLIIHTIFLNYSFSQNLKLVKEYELAIPINSIWTVDNLNHIYVASNDVLVKYDERGNKLFDQSFKKFGKISQIDARNPMKILVFCENQQVIYFLDNTLSKQDAELDLNELGFNYVTKVSASDQPDKIWIYDQNNSEISLLAQKQEQSIKIQNIKGLLRINNVSEFYERNDQLFLVDLKQAVWVLDIYGSLIQRQEIQNCMATDVNFKTLFIVSTNGIQLINLEKKTISNIDNQSLNIKSFKVNQQAIYFETDGKIERYKIEKI